MSINASNAISPSSLLNPAANRPQPVRQQIEREASANQNQLSDIRVNPELMARLDTEREARGSRQSFDANEQRNERAIAAYQSVQTEQRLAEVKQMLGVDLYA
ncbi:hypothetical protein [Arsukibacterium sp.]|uniref:hypothetical protein n=1 Tax=Arsukibacterium sp. TaxID=1977258 RepID=UPI002FD8DA9E